MQKTYAESGKYYAVIHLPNGQSFYRGPYNSRSAARKVAIKEAKNQAYARQSGMIVNYKI